MKKWLGSIVVLLALLVPIPVMAIGVSPYHANVEVYANSYAELTFKITGANAVDVSLEGIPLAVEPSHVFVVGGKITVKILGSYQLPSNTYNGYLLLLESGKQVGAGVKISLEVNHINPSVVMGGGDINLYLAPTAPRQPSPYVPPVTNSLPPVAPTYPTYDETNSVNPPIVPLQPTNSVIPIPALLIMAGVVLFIFGIYYYRNRKQQ